MIGNVKSNAKKRGACFYAIGHDFSKLSNSIPDDYINKIITGDSEEILKKLPDNCIDIIITSPPYNFGVGYRNYNDIADWNNYFTKLFAIFDQCARVLKYGGRIVIIVQPVFSDHVPTHHIISNYFMTKKMIWKGEIIWEKHNYNCKVTAWGSWKSPANPYLKYTWEYLEIFCKGTLKKKGELKDADITEEEFKRFVYAKWDIAPEKGMKEFGHPAMSPEGLIDAVLKLFSFKGDIVLDPFNGAGTTTLIAKKLGRQYLGVDISDEYNMIALDRLRKMKYQTSLDDFNEMKMA